MSRIRPHKAWPGIIIGLAGTACTLASGWSDLQGGDGEKADASTSRDGAKQEDGASEPEDSSVAADANPTGITELCGGFACQKDETCCFDPGFGNTCDTPAMCAQESGWILGCQSPAGCASGPCCFDFQALSSSCRPSCGVASVILCRPNAGDCPAGQECTRNIGNSPLQGCQ